MAVEEGLDTGAIYAEADIDIGPDETAEELRERMIVIGTDLVLDVVERGLRVLRLQEGEPTYASKISAEDLRLDWSQPAELLHRVVRVGGAWTSFRGPRFKVWRAAVEPARGLAPGELDGTAVGTRDGTLRLVEVQPEGRSRLPAGEWSRGARPQPGDRLGP
jgi:methionyl-tRNA formyltransferase